MIEFFKQLKKAKAVYINSVLADEEDVVKLISDIMDGQRLTFWKLNEVFRIRTEG